MNLHVYSAGCSWHGHISKVGKTKDLPETMVTIGGAKIKIGGKGTGLPCCPHCGSMLYQIETKKWHDMAVETEKTRPNYLAFLKWTEKQNRCWPNNSDAAAAYNSSPESWRQQYTHTPFNHPENNS